MKLFVSFSILFESISFSLFSSGLRRNAKKPSPPSTDEIQGALMRNFSDGVILQDYVKAESLESGKSSFKTTPGSLSLPFKDIEKFCESLLPKGSSPKVLEVCTLIMQKSD